MEPSAGVEVKVGIFVSIAVILAVGFIIALGGDKIMFHSAYKLKMELDDTSGLASGAVVQVAGVQCGNVSKVTFDPQSSKVLVTLTIDRQFQNRITEGSAAGIHTQGALGDKYVLIQPGTFGGQPLKDGDKLEVENNTDFLSTLSKSGNKVENAFEILENLNHIIRNLNDNNFAGNASETMRNLKLSTQSLEEILATIKGQDPKNNKIKKALDHLASIMEKIDDGQGTLGGLINDPTVHEDLKTILGGAQRSKLLKYLIHQAIKSNDDGTQENKK